jgi:capsular exopolysaccharide synthesis family protein
MQQSTVYEERLKEVQIQKNILGAAEKYLSDPNTKDANMALTGINDPTLSASITQFQQLRADRERLAQSLTENNPRLQQADLRLQEARNNIDVQLGNYRNNIRILENSLAGNMSQAQGMIRSTPREEKTLLEQSRMQAIKQELFLLLLQKREEAAINLAGVSVQSPVISPARVPISPVSPKRGQILIGSFLIGLILPVGLASIKEILNNKVTSKVQLEQMTSVPVIAEVDEVKVGASEVMVHAKDRSVFGEQVRTLRTKLNFYSAGKKPFYIMMTSSMSGEGKSFLASNLAASFALSGKKVALLEFDLRKPKLSEIFGVKKNKGIVNVLMGEEDPWNIREKVMPDHLLFLYSSGPIPPNPSELMEMEGMVKLKKYLDENYDVVIIDSAPYALVTDAHLLENWSDVSLFVVRFNTTEMEQIHEIEDAKQRKLFKNMAIIFNGLSTSGYYGYRGGYYGTKRKYGRAYTNEDKGKA